MTEITVKIADNRDRYRDLSERTLDPALLPLTSKQALMGRFDEWVTDREVTYERATRLSTTPASSGNKEKRLKLLHWNLSRLWRLP